MLTTNQTWPDVFEEVRSLYTKHERGFTLLEILAVLAIMGILAALAVPRFLLSTSTAEEEVCNANRGTIAVQVERYYLANGDYPTYAEISVNAYFPHGAPVCPTTGAAYTINGTTGAVTCATH